MNHFSVRDEADLGTDTATPTSGEAGQSSASASVVLRQRAVHRAVADLRRGVPVLLSGDTALVVVPAETVSAAGLAEFAKLADSRAVLLLAPGRAASVLRRPVDPVADFVAVAVPPGLLSPSMLRGLADPTVEQMLGELESVATLPAGAPAAIALVKLARLLPAALVAPAGRDAARRAAEAQLLSVPASDVLSYAGIAASHLVRVAEARVPLEDAPDARIVAFRAPDAGIEHLAILIGDPATRGAGASAPLVRVHSECFTGDLLGSLRCDCGPQLRGAIRRMAGEGTGALLYLAQEGRGIGLVNKLRAYAMQDRGLDTVDANRALGWGADERNFLVAATMLDLLGISAVRLLTNNPDKVAALAACGIAIEQRERHVVAPNGVNDGYLATKAARFGHLLD